MTISTRLGRLSKRHWDRWFAGACALTIGAAVSGVFGYLAFTGSRVQPSAHAKTLYLALLIAGFVVGALCGAASLAIKSEREDSVAAIKEDLDSLLKDHGPQ